jgi:enoyl-CoA hydratase
VTTTTGLAKSLATAGINLDLVAAAGLRVEQLSDHPHVLLVTIDRPPVNAATLELYRGLTELFWNLPADGEVRCVVLTGAGSRAFVGGADVKSFLTRVPGNSLQQSRISRTGFDAIRECVVPVVGAINGPAVGAGLVIAAVCDVLVASENATFGLPEIDVGILGGVKHLSLLVTKKQLRWMALSGKRLTAAEMLATGALEKVVSPEELMPTALAMADVLAAKSPPGLRLMKEVMNIIEFMDIYDGYHIEQLGSAIVSGLPESKEAAAAFLERRKPDFRGA